MQTKVKNFLEPYWKSYIVYEELPIVGTRMSYDFYNATLRVAIEVQGAQHTKFVPHFHNGDRSNFRNQLLRDEQKHKYAELNNILLIEVEDLNDQLNVDFFKQRGLELYA
jgi:hypothetical protein